MGLRKIFKINPLFLFFFSFSLLFSFGVVQATGINTPTVLDVEVTSQNKLQVEGLTPNNSKVLVYIDGKYKNLANIKEILKEGVNSFSYSGDQKIPAGKHHLTVVAQKQNSNIMSPPVDYDFAVHGKSSETTPQQDQKIRQPQQKTVSHKTPAPILIYPHFQNSTNTRPKILGLGANYTKVNIYLDGDFLTATNFLYHPSGTAGFTLMSPQKLSVGSHKIWAQAVDKSGKTSPKSNVLDFTITSIKAKKETSKISWKKPQLLTPENKATKPLSKLVISGQTEQIVEAIKIYIDNKPYSKVIPTTTQNTSQFSYHPQDLKRGTHTLFITPFKEGEEGPASSKITFSVTKPQIDKGIQEKNHSTSTTSTTKTTTSSNNILQTSNKIKYVLFGVLIVIILGWIGWINKNKIKEIFSKKQQ